MLGSPSPAGTNGRWSLVGSGRRPRRPAGAATHANVSTCQRCNQRFQTFCNEPILQSLITEYYVDNVDKSRKLLRCNGIGVNQHVNDVSTEHALVDNQGTKLMELHSAAVCLLLML